MEDDEQLTWGLEILLRMKDDFHVESGKTFLGTTSMNPCDKPMVLCLVKWAAQH